MRHSCIAYRFLPAVLFFTLSTTALHANPVLQITLGGTTINDNGAGDSNPIPGVISFSLNGTGWTASGVVMENIVDGVSASLTLTDLTIKTVPPALQELQIPFDIFTRRFGAIPPTSWAHASLDGNFVVRSSFANDLSANMSAMTSCAPIGGNLIANYPPVAFNKSTGLVPIGCADTQLEIIGGFHLGFPGGGVILPSSATASDAVSEPASLTLFMVGFLCAVKLSGRRVGEAGSRHERRALGRR